MRHATRIDENIALGRVPDAADLAQLKAIGYRTLLDVRAEEEKFGGFVEKRARALGFEYLSVPIVRHQIHLQHVLDFYHLVYDTKYAPLYVFSRFGKKPAAFLVLLEAIAHDEPLVSVFRRASHLGFDLRGDLCLQAFLVDIFNSDDTEALKRVVNETRPDLLSPKQRAQRGRRRRAASRTPASQA